MGFHETVESGESERFEGFGAELAELQKRSAAHTSKVERALHVKPHVGVVGSFVVEAAEAHRVGVFAENGRNFPVYIRFSNGSMRHRKDSEPDERGFALKLVGVEGKKIIPGLEDAKTQDFLFVGRSALPFRGPDEFMSFIRSAKDGPAKLIPRLIGQLGFFRALALLKAAAGAEKVKSYATHTFHTAAPISFGDTAAKLSLVPVAGQTASTAKTGAFRDDLVASLASGPLAWKLKAQLFIDDIQTPIEDASVVWTGPWIDLGTLTIAKQDIDSPQGKEVSALVETFSFDPWHALEAHKPLGAIMRARGVAYRVSVLGRKAAAEPTAVPT